MRSRRAASVVLGLLVAVTPAPQLGATPAAASDIRVDQVYPVPDAGPLTVHGHGYGHGHGMSQFGAQGAALQGLDYRQILAFYYPGTTLRTTRSKVRVLISADTSADVVVEARAGLTLRDRGARLTHVLPRRSGLDRWRLTTDSRNRDVVDYHDRRGWHRWTPGGADVLAGEGEFRARGPLTLLTPSGRRTYRGWLRAARPSPGSTDRDTVNVVKIDGYLKGVVPAEAYPSWKPAALQAQAVAARTYAAFDRAAHRHRYYQICDTSSCQVYGGKDAEVATTNAAVDATRRQILTHRGSPAFTQFSSSSGGWTAQGGFPYLPARRDPYDGWSGNAGHTWTDTLKVTTVENAYPSLGRLRRIRVTTRDGNGQWQGRILGMVLEGSRGDVRLTGDQFRSRFGLRSTWLSFS